MTEARKYIEAAKARGYLTECSKCGHLACVCQIRKEHEAKCRYRIAAASGVGFECEHGYDCCPICDPCTCDSPKEALDVQ